MESKMARRIFSRIGMALSLMIAIQQLLVAVIGRLVFVHFPLVTLAGWYVWALLYGPLYLVAFPVFLLFMGSIPDSDTPVAMIAPDLPRIGAGTMAKLLAASMGIMYPFQMLTAVISGYLAEQRGYGIENDLEQVVSASNPWYNLLFVVVVAPVMEEILFRRILYRKLIRFGGKVYVLYSAFVFALFHVSPYQLVYAFALGLLFAYLTYVTGSIRHSIALHMMINLVGSGAGPLLLQYGGERAIAIWGAAIMAGTLAGMVLVLAWLARGRKGLVFGPGQLEPPGPRDVLLGGGMLLYMAFVAVMVASIVLL